MGFDLVCKPQSNQDDWILESALRNYPTGNYSAVRELITSMPPSKDKTMLIPTYAPPDIVP
jgi:hypothetical protein